MRIVFSLLILFFVCCSKKNDNSVLKKSENLEYKKTLENESVAILIDISITMQSPDFHPNRLQSAIDSVKKIIENKKENQAFSIVLFSGNSFVLCPLTTNKEDLLNSINKIKNYWLIIKVGTNIPEALLNATNSLKNAETLKSILIFTDGATNVHSYPFGLVEKVLLNENIVLNAIYISPKNYELLPATMDSNGKIIFEKQKVKPMDETLFTLSKKCGGFQKRFYTVEDVSNFNFQELYSETLIQNKTNGNLKKTETENLSEVFSKLDSINTYYKNKVK